MASLLRLPLAGDLAGRLGVALAALQAALEAVLAPLERQNLFLAPLVRQNLFLARHRGRVAVAAVARPLAAAAGVAVHPLEARLLVEVAALRLREGARRLGAGQRRRQPPRLPAAVAGLGRCLGAGQQRARVPLHLDSRRPLDSLLRSGSRRRRRQRQRWEAEGRAPLEQRRLGLLRPLVALPVLSVPLQAARRPRQLRRRERRRRLRASTLQRLRPGRRLHLKRARSRNMHRRQCTVND